MHRRDFKDILFKALMLFIMALALSLGVIDYFSMEISFAKLLMYDSLIVLSITLLYNFPQIFGWGILISIIAAIYMKYYHSLIFDRITREVLLFMQWLPAYTAGYAVYLEEYAVPLLVTLLIFCAGLLAVLVFTKASKLIITAIGIIVFSFFWFTYVEKAHLYLMIYLFSSLVLHSYSLWEKKKEEWERGDVAISLSFYKSWVLSALLLLGLSILFMLMLPLNIRPLRFTALNDFMMQHFPFIEQWKNSSEESYGYSFRFSLSDAVYRGKRLGGPVNFDGSTMLSVKGNLKTNLYLRGSVYDKYSGFNWSKSRKSSEIYDNKKPIVLPERIRYKELEIEITPDRLVSSTLFNVLYPAKIKYDKDKIFINQDLELYGAKLIYSGTSYSIKSKLPVFSEDMLRSDISYMDDEISKLFLKLPKNIPDRVKDLAKELTKDKNGPYDKAKAIEGYLRNNYHYTLSPEKVPEGKDFVDYFLFEQKEGYCTYYATSMTILLRLAGIPSRYVEGFLLKPEGQGAKMYSLTDKEAHAWVEAYFGEYGWITFEATPAYEEALPWQAWEEDNIDETTPKSGENLPSFSQTDSDKPDREKELLEEDIYIGGDSKTQKDYKTLFVRIFAIAVAALVLSRIFYGIIIINRLKILMSKKPKRFAYIYQKYLIWLLDRSGMKKSQSQTFREFIMSIREHYEMDQNICEHIISIVEGIIYGEKPMSAQDADDLKKFAGNLKQKIKEKLGAVKYIWNFYLGKP